MMEMEKLGVPFLELEVASQYLWWPLLIASHLRLYKALQATQRTFEPTCKWWV